MGHGDLEGSGAFRWGYWKWIGRSNDALQLVHLYAERGSPKYEKAALRWLERYLSEGTPRLRHFAEVAADLARREA